VNCNGKEQHGEVKERPSGVKNHNAKEKRSAISSRSAMALFK